MKRWVLMLVIAFGAVTLANPAAVAAQVEPCSGEECEAPSGGVCFKCTSIWYEGRYWHQDEEKWWWQDPQAKWFGTVHTSWVDYGCGDAVVLQEHSLYMGGEEEEPAALIAVARRAVRDGTDDALLRALDHHTGLRINLERSALQVVIAPGEVAYHAPLSREQALRVSTEFAALQSSPITRGNPRPASAPSRPGARSR